MNYKVRGGTPGTAKDHAGYALGTHTAKGVLRAVAPEELFGDRDTFVAQETKATKKGWKNTYQEVILGFEEKLDKAIALAIVKSLLDYRFPGMDHKAMGIYAVLHNETGKGTDIHILIPMMDEKTGLQYNAFPPGHKNAMDPWRDRINIRYGLSRPDDIKNLFDRENEHKMERFSEKLQEAKRSRNQLFEALASTITQQIAANNIQSRDDVFDFLNDDSFKAAGIEVTSQKHHKKITISVDGGKGIRLKGAIYDERNYTANGFETEAEVGYRTRTRGNAKEYRECEKRIAEHFERTVGLLTERFDRDLSSCTDALEKIGVAQFISSEFSQKIDVSGVESPRAAGTDRAAERGSSAAAKTADLSISSDSSRGVNSIDLTDHSINPNALEGHENETAEAYYKRTEQIIEHDRRTRERATEEQQKMAQLVAETEKRNAKINQAFRAIVAALGDIGFSSRAFSTATRPVVRGTRETLRQQARAHETTTARASSEFNERVQGTNSKRSFQAARIVQENYAEVSELERIAEADAAERSRANERYVFVTRIAEKLRRSRAAFDNLRDKIKKVDQLIDTISQRFADYEARKANSAQGMQKVKIEGGSSRFGYREKPTGFPAIDQVEKRHLRSKLRDLHPHFQRKYQDEFDNQGRNGKSPTEYAEFREWHIDMKLNKMSAVHDREFSNDRSGPSLTPH